MALEAIEIAEATAHQRLIYAQDILNLELEGNETEEQVLAQIQKAQPGNSKIFVEMAPPENVQDQAAAAAKAAAEEAPPAQDGRITGSLGKGDPICTIMIQAMNNEDGSGNDDVAVGVNGRIWQLMRGHDLVVPWRVVAAIGLCEQDLVRHDEDGTVKITKAMRFPISFPDPSKIPSKEEVLAWEERTNDAFCP